MGELTNTEKAALGREAKKMLAKGSIVDITITSLTRNYINTLLTIEPGTPEAVYNHTALKCLDDFKKELMALQNGGTLAEKELKKEL